MTSLKHLARAAAHQVFTLRARLQPPRLQEPPVLVLGYPRSGTTWVAQVLGACRGALPIHEPLTQAWHADGDEPTLQRPQGRAFPVYRDALEALTAPATPHLLPARSVERPWRWLRPNGRRLVVKEVNLLATPQLLAALRPRVVFIERHPPAVYVSMRRLGWTELPEFCAGEGSIARQNGRRQAQVIAAAKLVIQAHGIPMIKVRYEELCRDPIAGFYRITRECGLVYDLKMDLALARTTHGRAADTRSPWSTRRDTAHMAQEWQRYLSDEDRDEVMAGWDDGMSDTLEAAE